MAIGKRNDSWIRAIFFIFSLLIAFCMDSQLSYATDTSSVQQVSDEGNKHLSGKDDQKILQLSPHVADQGNAEGQGSLGGTSASRQGVKKAVEHMYTAVQLGFGLLYTLGDGVFLVFDKSIELLQESAGQGDAKAQSIMGFLYDKGIGVPQNLHKAVEWYQKAADQGDTDAQKWIMSLKGTTDSM